MLETAPQIQLGNFANLSGTFTYNETAGEYRADQLMAGQQYVLYLNLYKNAQSGWILTDTKKQKKMLNPVKREIFLIDFKSFSNSGLCSLSGADQVSVEILEPRGEGILTF